MRCCRICPGRFLGDTSVWLAMASIMATFDIRKVRDSAGREVTPPPEFLSGSVRYAYTRISRVIFTLPHARTDRHPAPFSCVIQPRSEKSAELVSHESQQGSV